VLYQDTMGKQHSEPDGRSEGLPDSEAESPRKRLRITIRKPPSPIPEETEQESARGGDDDDDDEDTNPNHPSIAALHTPSSPPLQISHNATKLRRNKTIHDLFDVHQLIGEGGFGKVYRAIRRRDGVEVALKSIPIYRPDDHEESLHREVSAMVALSHPGHPHVCRLYHPPMRDHSHSYLAMEFIGGGELFEQLCEKGPFSERDAARFLRQFADGLRYIHSKGYVHADLKPENLLMGAEQTCLKIVDFGGSVPDNDESDVRLPHHRTVAYSPPESLAAAKDGGGAVPHPTPEGDMFAAGVIVYTVLTGTHPFDRTNQASDAAISRAIAECLFSLDQTGAGAGESTRTSEYLGRHVFDHRTEGLSPSSVELMKRLLHPRPEGRLTSSEFCTHPWILGHTATTHCLGHHPRFRQFWRRRFRVAILEKFWGTVVAHHNQQNKQQQQQQQQRSGTNPRETQGKKPKLKRPVLRRSQSLSLKDSEAIFRSMDLNGDGTVSLEEMKRCMMGNSSVVGGDGTSKFKQYMLDDIFSSVDEDGSGGIDLGEFQRVMAKPLPGIIDAGCHLGGGNESFGSSHDNEHVRGCILQRFGRIPTDDEAAARVTLRKIFDSMDINNDGVLQLSEAITVLRETPGLDEDMISAWVRETPITGRFHP